MIKEVPTKIGRNGEDVAEEYLRKHGYTIVERNFRVRGGEIDIIAKRRDELIFFEVKTRKTSVYGYPEQSVSVKKAFFVARAIREFVRRHRVSSAQYIRFDIIAIERDTGVSGWRMHHIENVEIPFSI